MQRGHYEVEVTWHLLGAAETRSAILSAIPHFEVYEV
jgi:hypothetical protein